MSDDALTREILRERIRRAIIDAGLSQRALAEKIGMDHTAIAKIIAGTRNVSSLELALIAEATHARVDELLAPPGPASPSMAATIAEACHGACMSIEGARVIDVGETTVGLAFVVFQGGRRYPVWIFTQAEEEFYQIPEFPSE